MRFQMEMVIGHLGQLGYRLELEGYTIFQDLRHTQFLLNNVKDKPESKEHENTGVGD